MGGGGGGGRKKERELNKKISCYNQETNHKTDGKN